MVKKVDKPCSNFLLILRLKKTQPLNKTFLSILVDLSAHVYYCANLTCDFLKISNLPISQSGFIHNIVENFDGNLTGLDYVESWLLPGLFRQIIIPSNLTLNFDYVHELEA